MTVLDGRGVAEGTCKSLSMKKDLPQSFDNHCHNRTLIWEQRESNMLLSC